MGRCSRSNRCLPLARAWGTGALSVNCAVSWGLDRSELGFVWLEIRVEDQSSTGNFPFIILARTTEYGVYIYSNTICASASCPRYKDTPAKCSAAKYLGAVVIALYVLPHGPEVLSMPTSTCTSQVQLAYGVHGWQATTKWPEPSTSSHVNHFHPNITHLSVKLVTL